MSRLKRFSGLRSASAISFVLISVLAAGCGDDSGLGTRYRVSGQVKYKGEPVEKGNVSFSPVDGNGRAATGQIDKGYYSLTTLSDNDGVLPGKYKILVSSQVIDDTELKAVAKGGQYHHDKTFLKAIKNAKSMVPSKYQLAETSGLEVEVPAAAFTHNIELTD